MGQAQLQQQQQKTTDERIKRRIQLSFASAIFTLLVAGSLSYRAILVSSESEQWVQHTHEVLERIQGVSLAAQSMESGYRGFVLTGDESHLARYQADIERLRSFHANLVTLTADNPDQQSKLPQLKALEDQKIAFAQNAVALRRAQGFEPAAALIRTGDGERVMDKFRSLVRDMRRDENVLLAQRIEIAKKHLAQTKIALILTTALGLLMTALAIWSIRRESLGRHLAERALRNSETKFRGLLEAAPDAVVVTDQDGQIILLNQQSENYFGYPREDLIGRNILTIIPCTLHEDPNHQPDPDETQEEAFRAACAILLQAPIQAFERIGHRKDASEFPIEIMLSPIDCPEGTLLFASVRDITERKIAEEQLAETNAKLRASNTELQQFAYVASHDLQEPLRMVASYTQLLAKRYKGKLDPDADQFIGYVVDGCNRMKRLIQDLLTYSRAGAPPTNLPAITAEASLKEALANLRAAIHETGAVLTYDPLPTLIGDPSLLVQVLQNLIGNAIKYRSQETPRIHIEARKNARKEWVFAVKDNGIGIDKKYAEKVFLLFQRLHGRGEYEGTGIGLAICKKLVERLGGRIWVESQPRIGSTFYFTLPEIQPTPTASTNPAPPTLPISATRGTSASAQPYSA